MTIAFAAVVVVAAVALIFGVPQSSKLLGLQNGHGWLTYDRQGQVMLANGETGLVDFRETLAESSLHQIEVVQSGKSAVLVDTTTGEEGSLNLNLSGNSGGPVKLSRLSGAGTGASALGTAATPSARTELLPMRNGDVYAVNRGSGYVSVVNPASGRTLSRRYVGGALTQGIVDGSGNLWVESQDSGVLAGAHFWHGSLELNVSRNSVVAPGNHVLLSSVNGVPAVVDQSRALFFLAPGGIPGAAVSIVPPTLAGSTAIAPTIQGSIVPIGATGHVYLVSGSHITDLSLNGRSRDRLGGPVPYASRIYVPDLSDNQIVVLDDQGQQVPGGVITLKGQAAFTQLIVQNGDLFIDNANSNVAYSVNSSGELLSIDKANPNVATTVTIPSTVPTPQPVMAPLPTPPQQPGSGPTVAATAPAAPGSPTAVAGDASATVTWTPPDPHGSPITSYKVTSSPGCSKCSGLNPATNSTTVSGLANGTTYTFSVSATNAVGTGPSAQSNSVTPSRNTPDPPTSVTATSGDGQITVKWTAANGQGHKVTGYTVTPITASGNQLTPLSAGTSDSANLNAQEGLLPGDTYTFNVVATNDSNTESGAASSNSALFSAAPLAVTGLTAKATGKGTATVTWQCDSACADGSPVDSFSVSTTPATSSATVPATSSTSYTTNLTGLADSTSYTVSVTANNKWGAGQNTTAIVVSEGQPTATGVQQLANGMSVTVSFTLNANGANVTSCAITGLSGGATASGTSCSSDTISAPEYNSSFSGQITIYSDYAPGGSPGATLNVQTGYKALDADATPDFGTCPSNPPPSSELYCGANSNSCSTTAYSSGGCPVAVAGGTVVDAACWTTGSNVPNSYSGADPGPAPATENSTVWVDIPGYGGDPWMSVLWFNPAGNGTNGSPTTDNLPHC